MSVTILPPKFTDEQLEADRAMREDAKSWTDKRVLPGTEAFGVIERHFPFEAEKWAEQSEWLYEALTGPDPLENPFETECPEWCTVTARGMQHGNYTDAEGRPYSQHEAEEATANGVYIGLVREDVLVNGTVESQHFITVDGGKFERTDVAGLLAMADTFRLAAGKYEKILSESK